MAVSISLSITQNSQSIANNTSNVTVKVTAKWTGGSFNRNDPSGSCTINGTKYTFTSDFNASQTTSGSQTIFSKTLNIAHGSDGKKTLSCSASYATGVSSGTVTASASKTLTTIPRKSTMSVGNGTLGTAQTLTVTRKSTSFTHTIVATCGSASTTICTKSTSTSIAFTPPIAWSSQNTTGTSVSVKYTITTYSGSTNVGSNSYTVSCAIPASVKPSCSLTVSDPTGCISTYGAYIQGLSKFTVSVSASGSYSSSIKSYRTTANGGTYTASSFTTGAISSSGTLTISTTVTDSRSRTATASKSVSVLAYASPKISAFSVTRCNQDGTANTGGSYIKVAFNSSVTSLSNKNKATYTLKYKKASEASYTSVTLSDYANNYAVSGGSYIFAADSASSYNVTLTLSDNFKSVSSSGTGSTASKTISLYNEGKGIAFGKVAETAEVLDSQWAIKEQGKLLSAKYTKRIALGGQVQHGDYRHGVIALCKTSAASTAINSYSSGTITFHRGNGLQGIISIDISMEGSFGAANGVNVTLEQRGFAYATPCTFKYNGVTYGGIKFYFSAASLDSVEFRGAGNFDIFGVDYYRADTGEVLNSEIYNSIYNITVNSSAYGSKYIHHNICIPNGTMIFAQNTSGTWGESFCGCSAANNITMGYASYLNKLGEGKFFGNRIVLVSNTDVRLGSTSGTVVTSDRNLKNDIEDVDDKYATFYNALRPVSYKYAVGNSGRPHIGFIAQEVEEALELAGMTTDNFAGICISDVVIDEEHEDPDMNYAHNKGLKQIYSLRYEEFIGLNTYMIQKLNDKVQEQQEEIDSLKEEMQQLKEMVAKLVS